MPRNASLLVVAALIGLLPPAARAQNAVPVRLVDQNGAWQLLRDGKPYIARGAGGDGSTELLAKLGGNSIRTWGVDNLGPILDDAQKRGLTVAVGIWLGQERQGFNYNDAAAVERQAETVRAAITRYKDHPAVLLWGLGNEMEGDGSNAAVWSAINNLASMAHKLDPNHPTMTVLAEIGGDKIRHLHRLCPDIDIVGINSYGGAASVPERYRKAGGTKPYMLTEFGPPGRWEIQATSWGAPPELSSTAKADFYKRAYEANVVQNPKLCVGSYAFVWGHKQEATATWFGLLLPDGSRTGGVDALSALWSGKPLANRCPEIKGLTLEGPDQFAPSATAKARLDAADPDGDPLQVEWILSREAGAYGNGGDAEAALPTFAEAIKKASPQNVEFVLPDDGGGYRLFAYVRDNHGGAAVANIPLLVKAPQKMAAARKATLPLVVFDEPSPGKPLPFAPSGWMGDTKALRLDEACPDRPQSGTICLRVELQASSGWGGIVWQDPPNDWGDRPGGHDLSGAKKLTFWARSPKDGQTASFELGLLGPDKKFHDSGHQKLENVRLTPDWKPYSIDLTGLDLSRIKTGFAIILRSEGAPVTVDLDQIRYE